MINLESKLFQIKDYKSKQKMLDAIAEYKMQARQKYEGKCELEITKEENGLRVVVGPVRGERELIRTRDEDDEEGYER